VTTHCEWSVDSSVHPALGTPPVASPHLRASAPLRELLLITFTSADDTTSTTYIFAGNSFGFFPTIAPTEVQANDFAAMDGTLLNPGDPPFGLAHINFTADPSIAPGVIPLTLIDYKAGTSLSNTDGENLDFTIVNGQITITGSAVPEPSSIIMAATALLASLALFRRSRVARHIAV
jgi:PEP-CTERM motif